jgi:hypothetical protein
MIKRFVIWLCNLIEPPFSEREARLIERHYQKFCKELKNASQQDQLMVKDTIIRMFLGVAVRDC